MTIILKGEKAPSIWMKIKYQSEAVMSLAFSFMAKKEVAENKKLKIGWFSFSCCEDSTIVFTELLNDHFEEWSKVVDFQYVRVLRKKNKLEGLDVAFVEGAIASDREKKELLEIRKNCKKLVAIGSCACTGGPS